MVLPGCSLLRPKGELVSEIALHWLVPSSAGPAEKMTCWSSLRSQITALTRLTGPTGKRITENRLERNHCMRITEHEGEQWPQASAVVLIKNDRH